jgi:hypothetical protein
MRAAALVACLLLPACDRLSHTSISQRSTADGVDLLHVETEVVRDVATLRCLASRSGQCRIVLYTRRCEYDVSLREGRLGERCETRALGRYDLAIGQVREVRGLPKGFRQCSSPEGPMPADCAL